MEQSFVCLRANRIDRMQMNQLVDWRVQLASRRRLPDAGRVRYIGITHCTASSYPEAKAVLVNQPFGGGLTDADFWRWHADLVGI